MGLFSKARRRTGGPSPFPAEKWSGLLQSTALSSEMYCSKHSAAVSTAREEAASHLAAGRHSRARLSAETALRDRARTRALGQVAALAGALRARNLALGKITSLADLTEPARTELVSLVWASGRVAVAPLAEASDLLRPRFPMEVDEIVRAQGSWPDFLDTRLYEALAPGPADADLVEAELEAAARDYPAGHGSGRGAESGSVDPRNMTGSSSGSPEGGSDGRLPEASRDPRRVLSGGAGGVPLPMSAGGGVGGGIGGSVGPGGLPSMPPAIQTAGGSSIHPAGHSSPALARLPPPDSPPIPSTIPAAPAGPASPPRPWERAPRVPLGVLGAARAPAPPPPPSGRGSRAFPSRIPGGVPGVAAGVGGGVGVGGVAMRGPAAIPGVPMRGPGGVGMRAPPVGHPSSSPIAGAEIAAAAPPYAVGFRDDDENLLRRYRDLLKA